MHRGGDPNDAVDMHSLLLFAAQPLVGLKSGRFEPHLVKRRHSRNGLISVPRVLGAEVRPRSRPFAPNAENSCATSPYSVEAKPQCLWAVPFEPSPC